MSDQANRPEPTPGEDEAPLAGATEMRIRPDRPPVTRLSRKVLLGLSGVAAVGIAGVLFFALRPQSHQSPPELFSGATRKPPEALSKLPRDYAGPKTTPRLGPPLPGDLGKPILNAGAPAPGITTASGETPEQQRLAQEQNSARTSHLFATTNASATGPAMTQLATTPALAPSPTATEVAASDHKLAFLDAAPDRQTQSPDRLEAPPSPYTIQAGTIIPAALITGLRSDLPGEVTAQVTQEVRGGPTGRVVLIPQGAKLMGHYDAQVTFGQSRALLVWNRLIMPNGRSIILQRQPGIDTEGYAGLEDEVDNHWGLLFKAAILSTLLSVGSEAGTSNSENNLAQAIRQGASQSFNQVGEQVVGRSLTVQPTLTIRPGFPVNVMVTHDLVLEPYQP
jgi:type IV secretory pathway VirB10-like protein